MSKDSPKIFDRKGNEVCIGDIVKIIDVPDLSGIHPKYRAYSIKVFEYLVGKYKKVSNFEDDLVWIRFRINKGECKGFHSVSLESNLLQVKKNKIASKK